jgi:cysteine desulfurase
MRVYLDHNATTPLHPEALEAMRPYLTERFGNPSSVHAWGREARSALEAARESLAGALGATDKDSVVFTGGGTEADNLALRGVMDTHPGGGHLIVTSVEHHAILHTVDHLERRGYRVTRLSVDEDGRLDPEDVRRAIGPQTLLVSAMHGNNETGVLFPIREIAAICRERGVPLHTDAIQSFGKLPVDVEALGVDLLSISGHKIGGPKGIGALYVRRGTKMVSLHTGGWQERSRRGGTENVAGAIGFARAAELMRDDLERAGRRMAELRDRLESGLSAAIPEVRRNGDPTARLPQTSSLAFPGTEAESLILALDLCGIGVSSGAACSSGSLEPSHVLTAMGLPHDRVQSSVRFSLGRETTVEEIDCVLETLPPIVERMRRATGRRPGREHERA